MEEQFTWNDLLIKILDMTPEERKTHVFAFRHGEYDESKAVYGLVKTIYGQIYLAN